MNKHNGVTNPRLLIVLSLISLVGLGAGLVINKNRFSQASSLVDCSGEASCLLQDFLAINNEEVIVDEPPPPIIDPTESPVNPTPSPTETPTPVPTNSIPPTSPANTPNPISSTTGATVNNQPANGTNNGITDGSKNLNQNSSTSAGNTGNTLNNNKSNDPKSAVIDSANPKIDSKPKLNSLTNTDPDQSVEQVIASLPDQSTDSISLKQLNTLRSLAQDNPSSLVVFDALRPYVVNGLMSARYMASQILAAQSKPRRFLIENPVGQIYFDMVYFVTTAGKIY